MKYPAMACCYTEDDENICVLPFGHNGEHQTWTGKKCNHTPQPTTYLAWHAWAKRMSKTHKQRKCPHCGLWSIWIIDTKKSAKSAASTRRTTKASAKDASRTENTNGKALRNVRYF